MDLVRKLEASLGASLSGSAILSIMMQDIYPILSFIAVTCGAILGIHGVWGIIRRKYPDKRRNDEQNYF